MKLSKRIEQVKPSTTLAVTAKAKALRKQGVDILALSAGEPDFDTPENIKAAAHDAIAAGKTKYTPVHGTPELRNTVALTVSKLYDRPFESKQVIVGVGGKQVLFNACAALLDPGDEAVFGSPYWVSYPDMVRFAGAKPRPVVADGNGFLPKAKDLETAFTDKTRLLILNSPSNPTGAAYDRRSLLAIAELLRAHPDVFVITDDIYSALVYDGDFVSIAQVAPDLADRTLIATGVSKTYSMTGWRIGFGIGPEDLIAAMSRLQGASTSGACSIAQAAATEALRGDQKAVAEMRRAFRGRRDRIVAALRDIPNVEVLSPAGAFYVFPRVSHYLGGQVRTTPALCEFLLEQAHLAVVPGAAFGSDAHVRMSFACSDRDIDEGIERLKFGLSSLRG